MTSTRIKRRISAPVKTRPRRQRRLYRTRQIDLDPGEQIRVTAGNRTVFIWVDGRGLHFGKGGYARQRTCSNRNKQE